MAEKVVSVQDELCRLLGDDASLLEAALVYTVYSCDHKVPWQMLGCPVGDGARQAINATVNHFLSHRADLDAFVKRVEDKEFREMLSKREHDALGFMCLMSIMVVEEFAGANRGEGGADRSDGG